MARTIALLENKIGLTSGLTVTNPATEEIGKAIEKVQKEKDTTLLEHFVRRAYEDDRVLIAVMKKIIADMKHIEADLTVETYEERVKRLLEAVD